MYYKITAVYSENDIKHIKTLFQQHAILYMLNQDAHIFLFFSLKHIGIHMHTHPHSHTRTHTRAHTHTHTHAHVYEHTYIHTNTHTYTYYVVTTGLSTVHISTVHISHKY